jgi:TolB protein
MNADGSGRRNLTRRPVDYGGNDNGASPAWSPDGRKIAFDRGRGIFVMNADGSGQRRLTQFGRQALWSPDGRMIAFRSWGADNVEIFVMNADGSGLQNLTRTPKADEVGFAWSPVLK